MTAVPSILSVWLLRLALTSGLASTVVAGPPTPLTSPGRPVAHEADEITVTASGLETALAESPTAVTVLGGAALRASAAVALDDTLRQVPGFTLFRRSGSRSANPTTQGASLRGIGGSAASRALVLADGVPLNDPFGGWVTWGRVPRLSLARVEVVRGGASDLYGSSALVGVIHLLRREPSDRALEVETSAGGQGTGEASAWGSIGRGAGGGRWAGAVAADLLTTDGFIPVAPAERGVVDTPAGVEHRVFEGSLTWRAVPGEAGPGGTERIVLRGSWFDEDRANGTDLQANDTESARLTLGADGRAADGAYSLRLWAGDQDFHQTFSAVSFDRESERKVREQTVPSEEAGLTARFVRELDAGDDPAERSHVLVTGLDLRRVEGRSKETLFFPSGGTRPLATGGEQLLGGLYVEDLVRLSARLSAQLALRYDRWSNRRGFRRPGSAGSAAERFGARSEEAWSPRLALRFQPSGTWSLAASAYRSFRAPTLNELYRGFRVGNVVTDPNETLTAERLTGVEVGAVWTPEPRWRLRGTLFRMELEDTIANVTVAITPELILRQRQNLGRSRSRGIELEASGRLGNSLTLDAGYLWTRSEVTDFPADPTLEGRRTPQVPEHQASLRLGWRAPGDLSVRLQARWADSAFDDDRNLFPLGSLTVVDVRIGRPIGRRLEAFLAAENLLDDDYVIGRTPVTTIGSPRLARIGVRYRLGR